MRKMATVFLGLALTLAAKAPLHEVQITTTDRADLGPGGTVRISGSYGQLDVEGWDQPRVEVTVTRSVWRSDTPRALDQAKLLLQRVAVKAERRDSGEVAITTVMPSRNLITRPLRDRTEINLEYTIRVPRDAHLVIHHGSGDIRLAGVTAAIEAVLHQGDIELRLPEANPHSIDAKCGIGGVYSDFAGEHRVRWLAGEDFENKAAPSAAHIYLRADVGGIQILKIPAIAMAPE